MNKKINIVIHLSLVPANRLRLLKNMPLNLTLIRMKSLKNLKISSKCSGSKSRKTLKER